jgi:hypothetical protein
MARPYTGAPPLVSPAGDQARNALFNVEALRYSSAMSTTAGQQLNPRWNEVYPLRHPNHRGEAPTGGFVGFGDPGQAIGQVISMDSSFPAGSGPPYWAAQTGKRLVLTVPVGLFALLACQMVYRSILIANVKDRALFSTIGSLQPLVFVVALGLAVGLYFLSGVLFKKVPAGRTYTATMVGTEGMAIFTRGPVSDEATVVRYEGVMVQARQHNETTIYKDQYGNRKGSQSLQTNSWLWVNEAGQTVYRFHWKGHVGTEPRAQLAFLSAAESAQFKHRVARSLPLLDGPGMRFTLGGPDFIHVQRSRLDFTYRNQPFSIAPGQVAGVSVSKGQVTMKLPQGPLTFTTEQAPDARMMLTALGAIGVQVS